MAKKRKERMANGWTRLSFCCTKDLADRIYTAAIADERHPGIVIRRLLDSALPPAQAD